MELPDVDSGADAASEALAARLGVEAWQVALTEGAAATRRSARQMQFELVADEAQASAMKEQLIGMSAHVHTSAEDPQELAIPEGEVWEESDGQFLLRACAPGYRLINSTEPGVLNVDVQRCERCLPNTYILDQLGSCVKCPKGAYCPDGVQFVPNALGSVWEEVQVSSGDTVELVKRIVECPAGYALEREEESPSVDNCLKCESGTYRLDPTDLTSVRRDECIPCHSKATCWGGDRVEAVKGYWRFQPLPWGEDEYLPDGGCEGRLPGEVCLFPSEGWVLMRGWGIQQLMTCNRLPGGGDELFCSRPRKPRGIADDNASDFGSAERVVVVRCPIGACGANNSCLQNRSGSTPAPAFMHICVYIQRVGDRDREHAQESEEAGYPARWLQ
jgi:hypothetical protein